MPFPIEEGEERGLEYSTELVVVSGGHWYHFISASRGAGGNEFPVFALDLLLCAVYLLTEACFSVCCSDILTDNS